MGPPKNTLVGNVGYGNVKAEDPDNIATNVLVIMAARPTKSSNANCVFSYTRKTSVIQAQLILEAIKLLYLEGIIVKSVTFDGPTKSISTAKKLGCEIE